MLYVAIISLIVNRISLKCAVKGYFTIINLIIDSATNSVAEDKTENIDNIELTTHRYDSCQAISTPANLSLYMMSHITIMLK